MIIPHPGRLDLEWLQQRFGQETSPGWSQQISSRSGEQIFSRTAAPAVMCWSWAREVQADLGTDRVDLTGYFCSDSSTAKMAGLAEGHDLALIDGRFLVDGWLAHVAEAGPCVMDLEDPAGLSLALQIHEPFSKWTIPPHQWGQISRIAA